MSVFFWAVIGAFLVLAGARPILRIYSPGKDYLDLNRFLIFVGALVLVVTVLAQFDPPLNWSFEWRDGWTLSSYLVHVRQVVFSATMVQLIIGAAFGVGLACISRDWAASRAAEELTGQGDDGTGGDRNLAGRGGRQNGNDHKAPGQGGDRRRWYHWIAAVIVALLIIGAFGPELGRFIGKITRVSTPFGEAEFTQAAAVSVPTIEEDRRVQSEDYLPTITQLRDRGVIADQDHLITLGVLTVTKTSYFESTLVLLEKLEHLFNAAEDARQKLQDIGLIRQHLRLVVIYMRRLLDSSRTNVRNPSKFKPDDFREQVRVFENSLAETSAALKCQVDIKADCKATERAIAAVTYQGMGPLLKEAAKGPYVAILIAYLYAVLEDFERAIEVLERQQDFLNSMGIKFDEEFNSFYSRGFFMYLARRDADDILPILDEALQRVRRQIDDLKRVNQPAERFYLAEAVIENGMVWSTAVAMLSGPRPARSWVMRAKIHARHLEAIMDGKIKHFPPHRRGELAPEVLDTLGYFRLALALTEEVNRQDNLDAAEIFLARAAGSIRGIPALERGLIGRTINRHQRLLQDILRQQEAR